MLNGCFLLQGWQLCWFESLLCIEHVLLWIKILKVLSCLGKTLVHCKQKGEFTEGTSGQKRVTTNQGEGELEKPCCHDIFGFSKPDNKKEGTEESSYLWLISFGKFQTAKILTDFEISTTKKLPLSLNLEHVLIWLRP